MDCGRANNWKEGKIFDHFQKESILTNHLFNRLFNANDIDPYFKLINS